MKRIARQPKIGDVIEIKTPRGIAYAQYCHFHPENGELIRVLPGLYQASQQVSIPELVKAKEGYSAFYPVGPAVSRKLVSIVAHESVPDRASEFPLMRTPPGSVGPDGFVANWLLWDGTKHWRPLEFTEAHKDLPCAGTWNHVLLVERIIEGWVPRDDFKVREKKVVDEDSLDPAETDSLQPTNDSSVLGELSRAGADLSVPHPMQHYLYFGKKSSAIKAARELENRTFQTDVSHVPEDGSWLVLVSHSALLSTKSITELRIRFEQLAHRFDGEYDGWEAGVAPSN